MEQLRMVSRQLNEATDDASKLIVQVEKFLNQECSLGIAAGVVLSEGPLDKGLWKRVELKYGRLDRLFGLSICTKTMAGDDGVVIDRDVVPLAQAPRIEKLLAVAQLPALLVKLSQKATEIASKAKDSSQNIGQLLGRDNK